MSIGDFLNEQMKHAPQLEKEDKLSSIENQLLDMAEDLKVNKKTDDTQLANNII